MRKIPLKLIYLTQIRKNGGWEVVMANSPSGTSTSVRDEVGCLSVKLGKAGFGGGQGRFFFAECKADLLGAVARVVVKAGAGNGGHADLFDEIFREGDVFCSRSKTPRVRIREARNVRHDVVRAAWLEHREARSLENLQQPRALLHVTGGELVVVTLRRVQRNRAGLLQRSGSAHGKKILNPAD